jgi:prefoldin subunit 5
MLSATQEFPSTYVNPRGIPRVPFVEDVGEYVKTKGLTPETIMRQFQEQHSKCKLMEHKLSQNRFQLAAKIPEIMKTMETVQYLKKRLEESQQAFVTHFGLTDSVFVEAEVEPQTTVHLWLGANVMAEYTFDEALALLEKNFAAAKTNLDNTNEDLAWLREQTTILEVSTARVYNFDVVQRRTQQSATK